MLRDVQNCVKECDHCLKLKAKPQKTKLQPILITHPLELVHMDYLTTESGKRDKDVNILVIPDHFTRYMQAIIIHSWTAKATVQVLWNKFIVHYGLSDSTVSDQGRNYESDLVQELCMWGQVRKMHTAPNHHSVMVSASTSIACSLIC